MGRDGVFLGGGEYERERERETYEAEHFGGLFGMG